ncbi:hypothetical protein BOX15_Mlig017382g2 [Macrostomum lignano]|uniref:LIM zinc-binding domain-containing protein n=1 Tax=Macrostomum lignano TaxID=282301 RepID=A0A267EIK7_9PLAT|nr:hypothetical protein BOX15_Mlig017382g2 [Macrostomum lignano]
MKVLCLVCSKRCKGEVLRVQDQYVHRGCFTCSQCQRSLERGGFFLRDGRLFCPDDFARLHGVRCRGCGGSAAGEVATAMGATFHPACFRCHSCQTAFSPGDRVVLCPERDVFLCRPCAQGETSLRQPLSVATGDDLSNGGVIAPTAAAVAASEPPPTTASGSSRRHSNDDFDGSTRRNLLGSVDGLSNSGAKTSGVLGNATESVGGAGGRKNGGLAPTPPRLGSGPQRRARSYLSIQSEMEARLPPSDRYRRGLSPCGSVRSLSPRRQLQKQQQQQQQQQQQHFHVPQPPPSRSTMSITTAPSTPGSLTSVSRRSRSIATSRPGSVGGQRRRRSPSASADEDEADPVLLSQFPGASRPDLSRPAPIGGTTGPARRCQLCCPSGAAAAATANEAPTMRRRRILAMVAQLLPSWQLGSWRLAGWSSEASAPLCCSLTAARGTATLAAPAACRCASRRLCTRRCTVSRASSRGRSRRRQSGRQPTIAARCPARPRPGQATPWGC